LRELRGLCDEAGVLLIADEIWTGIGRCGSWLASVADGAVPDLVCVGKALGGGLPISACIGTPAVMEAWGRHGGSVLHTATHFGAPLSCAVARAVIGALREEGWVDRSGDAGEALIQTLTNAIAASPARGHVAEVRGRGLMVGVALRGGSAQALRVVRSLLRRHVIALTGGVGGDVVTFTPALNVDRSTFKQVAEALVAALEEKACP
jgi:4-aminobutyrate aminotransferase/(S)-3-amino-2-methylpropionate transaminase